MREMMRKDFILSILLVLFLVVPSVSAADNSTEDIIGIDGSDSVNVVESINEFNETLTASPKSFSDLNNLINGESSNIYLDSDYRYNPTSDSQFAKGIVLSRSINIYGQGHTIDGNNQARIFNASAYVSFNNVHFINANSDRGSAIIGSNYAVTDSYFTNNHATLSGGAMAGGFASNCVFESNSAVSFGGAIYQGSADECTFISNSASEGGAINEVYATNSKFESNTADKNGGAMYGSSASQCTFIKNSAKEFSGAVFNAYVVDCTFINNTAKNAGALGGGSNSAQNCIFTGNYATYGGAVYGYSILNSQFRQNHATKGGAIYTGSASNCIFEKNYATEDGGALLDTYVINCNFTENSANRGGAMFQNSAKDCNFLYNSANYGGAVYNAHVENCKLWHNSAKIQGGAIDEGVADSSDLRYNTATNGGAVSLTDLLACNLVENTATDYGGGAYKSSARRCLFQKNVAKFGAAISVSSSASECVFKYNSAKITGGAKYDSFIGESEFEGNSPSYTLKANDLTGIYGFGGNIHISLYDSPDYQVTGVNASIKVYNSKNAVIGKYKSEIGYNWFVNLPAGKYKAQISVDDECYEVDPIKISITFLKSSFIYAANVTTNYKAGKVLIVNLHDSDNKIIKYAKISVTLDGVAKSYLTDENGQVMIPTKTLTPDTYVASISFAGDNNYAGCIADAKIIVKKLTPKLTAPKATLKLKDKTKKYVVTLKDNKNKVMKSAKITITVNGKSYTAKTNSKGQAVFKLKKLTKKGTYKATVKYSGSSIYNSVKKTVKITVKK